MPLCGPKAESRLRMTDEQRNLATDNHNLIYTFLHKNNLEVDDWYDIVSIGFCKGICTFAAAKGALSTYCWKCMAREYLTAKEHSVKDLIERVPMISIDADYADGDNPGMHDLVTVNGSFENAIVDSIVFKDWILRQRQKDLPIIRGKLMGLSAAEVGRRMGCTRANVSRIIQDLKLDYYFYARKKMAIDRRLGL